MQKQVFDIVIIGAGISGCALALQLAQKTNLNIALLDAKQPAPQWQAQHYGARVSAINESSRRLFVELGVWQQIADKRATPYLQMSVFDAQSIGEIHFDCADIAMPHLGHLVENDLILQALLARINTQANIETLWSMQLASLQQMPNGIFLTTKDHAMIEAKLVVGADGANSWVRQAANIACKQAPYQQAAIIATVKTTQPHQQVARQAFLHSGPLAFLPLQEANAHSIVWSCEVEKANHLMMIDDAKFKQALQLAYDFNLGEVQSVSTRFSFPLTMRHVEQYYQPHIALVGDAAHTIHPLAGQGLNIALQDVNFLTQLITHAIAKQVPFNGPRLLRKYSRARKAENTIMVKAMGGFKNLFAEQKPAVMLARSQGMRLVNHFTFLKNYFIKQAMGLA